MDGIIVKYYGDLKKVGLKNNGRHSEFFVSFNCYIAFLGKNYVIDLWSDLK